MKKLSKTYKLNSKDFEVDIYYGFDKEQIELLSNITGLTKMTIIFINNNEFDEEFFKTVKNKNGYLSIFKTEKDEKDFDSFVKFMDLQVDLMNSAFEKLS